MDPQKNTEDQEDKLNQYLVSAMEAFAAAVHTAKKQQHDPYASLKSAYEAQKKVFEQAFPDDPDAIKSLRDTYRVSGAFTAFIEAGLAGELIEALSGPPPKPDTTTPPQP